MANMTPISAPFYISVLEFAIFGNRPILHVSASWLLPGTSALAIGYSSMAINDDWYNLQ